VDDEIQKSGRKVLTNKLENEILKQDKFQANLRQKGEEDYYTNFKDVGISTLEGLVSYMGIPETKQKLINVLVSFRKENRKVFKKDK